MKIPAGKGVLMKPSSIKDNVVAVSISIAIKKDIRKMEADDEAYHIECAQNAWPLGIAKTKAIQSALERGEHVIVLAYRTLSPKEIVDLGLGDKDCDISERRLVEAVFRLDQIDGVRVSGHLSNTQHPKTRYRFTLQLVNDELKDKYLKNRLLIRPYQPRWPLIMGGLKK